MKKNTNIIAKVKRSEDKSTSKSIKNAQPKPQGNQNKNIENDNYLIFSTIGQLKKSNIENNSKSRKMLISEGSSQSKTARKDTSKNNKKSSVGTNVKNNKVKSKKSNEFNAVENEYNLGNSGVDCKRKSKKLGKQELCLNTDREKLSNYSNQYSMKAPKVEKGFVSPKIESKQIKKHLSERNIMNNKALVEQQQKQDCGKTQQPIKRQRFAKFSFRSEKYIKMNEELKKQGSLSPEQDYVEKPVHSLFKARIINLNRDISNYREMSSKSTEALKVMQDLKTKEHIDFLEKKHKYLDEIKRLQEKIESEKINLGHVYTYKEVKCEQLIPNMIIPEKQDDEQDKVKQRKTADKSRINKGKIIVKQYLQRKSQIDAEFKQENQNCLSIVSKYSDEDNNDFQHKV